MKYRTAELTGSLLDAAVALAEGGALPDFWRDPDDGTCWLRPAREEWRPSSRWDQGGPIIDREKISLLEPGYGGEPMWTAGIGAVNSYGGWEAEYEAVGQTALTAAMRAYVASKLGDEVEL